MICKAALGFCRVASGSDLGVSVSTTLSCSGKFSSHPRRRSARYRKAGSIRWSPGREFTVDKNPGLSRNADLLQGEETVWGRHIQLDTILPHWGAGGCGEASLFTRAYPFCPCPASVSPSTLMLSSYIGAGSMSSPQGAQSLAFGPCFPLYHLQAAHRPPERGGRHLGCFQKMAYLAASLSTLSPR